MKRIIVSTAIGAFVQLAIFLAFQAGRLLPNQNIPASLVLILRLVFGVLILAMPGYWLFVQGASDYPNVIRAFAIAFDIALYSIIVYSILWWRERRSRGGQL